MSLISNNQNVFVIDLHYVAPVEEVDALLEDHRAFLETNYSAGRFLASGAEVPRNGGVILAVGESRETIEGLIKQDPFHAAGVADYSVTEFEPRMCAPGLKSS